MKATLHSDKKLAGVLAPLFAIRGKDDLGVGDTRTLKELGDWARQNGFGVVQILPFNETCSDNSPYNIISSVAIEPSTISTCPEDLPDLKSADFSRLCKSHRVEKLRQGDVDYTGAKALKWALLRAAFKNFESAQVSKKTKASKEFSQFLAEQENWLVPYALFRALMEVHRTEITDTWPAAQQNYHTALQWLSAQKPATQKKIRVLMDFYSYVQWIAHRQWSDAHDYLDSIGVALMGDIPVGVSRYSADIFAEPEIFDLTRSSGAPPEKVFKTDAFTQKWGQNWGFPLYKWEAMSRDNYAWWRRRVRMLRNYFHLFRVDHALGFFRIYSFPWKPEQNADFLPLNPQEAKQKAGNRLPCFMERDDSSAENRELNREQGENLFSMLQEEAGKFRVIAEDLGELSPYVRPVLEKLEIAGFKIPQWERQPDGRITPGAEYPRISVTTYATHDHEPVKKFWDDWFAATRQTADAGKAAWATHCMQEMMEFAGKKDIPLPQAFTEDVQLAFLEGLFKSNAWLAINMVTDLFALTDRFNAPGEVSSSNWTKRLELPISSWNERWKAVLSRVQSALAASGRLPKA